MEPILSGIIMLASILLVFVVYVQNPKGGGLSTDFGAAQQLGGVQKTNNFIDKATWSLAGIIAALSVFLTIKMKSPEPTPPPKQEQTEQGQQQGEQAVQKQDGNQGQQK